MNYQYFVHIIQTRDDLWHLQIFRECQFDVQVLKLITAAKLIKIIDTASALQLHVDNIDTLPLTQYAIFRETA